ncbi:hypothetical protein, partial [Lysinibacillus sp. NPDC096212]|uniref:hypothetical protein n=1 Tax=Lysinibacillus sp. NPDC096212 TaxID=3364135 RepID=UPI0038173139
DQFSKIPEQFYSLPDQFSKIPEQFFSLPDQFSKIPEQFYSLPDQFLAALPPPYLKQSFNHKKHPPILVGVKNSYF